LNANFEILLRHAKWVVRLRPLAKTDFAHCNWYGQSMPHAAPEQECV